MKEVVHLLQQITNMLMENNQARIAKEQQDEHVYRAILVGLEKLCAGQTEISNRQKRSLPPERQQKILTEMQRAIEQMK
jgi:hypothetical protein